MLVIIIILKNVLEDETPVIIQHNNTNNLSVSRCYLLLVLLGVAAAVLYFLTLGIYFTFSLELEDITNFETLYMHIYCIKP